MQVMKKKKSDAESQHEDYNEFKSDEDKHDSQCKKEEKKLSKESKSKDYNEFECNEGEDARGKERKKKKLCKESKSKEHNELESNEGEDDARGTKRKKKKLSKESKSKEYNEFESIEGEDDVQAKKRKKKNLSKESKSMEYNTFEKNEEEDDAQGKERKKKKLSKESKSKEYNEFESVEGEDDVQGKKRKKKKLSKESKSKEYNEFESIECEDDVQGKKRKKRKLSKESKSKEYNVFEKNEGEDDDQGKKRKKKKLSEESKSKEYNNEFESNEGEDDSPGVEKKKLHNKGKNKENSKFNSKEGDPPLARVTEVDDQSKKMKTKKKAEADNGETPNPAQSGLSKPKRVTFSDKVDVCCDGLIRGKRFTPEEDEKSGLSKPKRVTFSDKVDVCCDGLIRGKRFTPEEDEKIKLAVFDYIESHGLGDEGLDMVLHCKSHSEVRNCWREIGAALPEMPYVSVYTRAHVLFERDEKRKWTPDEYEFLRKVYEQHGSNWITVAEAMGKHRYHVKDAWRRIKLSNTKKGRWTQEEYQNLFDLVNQDLRVRALQGYRKSRHGMLRDNIGWEAIGDKLATRNGVHCCQKWYSKLTSPLVASGAWSDTDDYRLVNALVTLDACCMEQVDWDNLLEHRPGDVCRKRWNQMVQCIGEHGGKSFAEQVEILAKRFCPDLVEVREAFDAKPLVC